jgi:hypothetical protein
MTLPEFKTREDLTDYLTRQEQRIQNLEQANAELITEIKKRFIHKDELPEIISDTIPNTGLFSRSFIKRAFSVWGHFLVAQLILAAIFSVIYFVIFILILSKITTQF